MPVTRRAWRMRCCPWFVLLGLLLLLFHCIVHEGPSQQGATNILTTTRDLGVTCNSQGLALKVFKPHIQCIQKVCTKMLLQDGAAPPWRPQAFSDRRELLLHLHGCQQPAHDPVSPRSDSIIKKNTDRAGPFPGVKHQLSNLLNSCNPSYQCLWTPAHSGE